MGVTVSSGPAFCESCDSGGGRTAQLSVWCGDAQLPPTKVNLCAACIFVLLGGLREWVEQVPPSTLT